LEHRENLCEDEQAMAIKAVREHARNGGEEENGAWLANPTTPSSNGEALRR
jgi:hypothetical protein